MPSDGERLMIIGASVRAAAMSAIRAGWRPWCADLFADADLQRVAPVVPVTFDEYPKRFLSLVEDGPDSPWMYTGGLENHPRLVNAIAKRRRLLGISGSTLLALRTPSVWPKVLQDADIPCPMIAEQSPNIGGGDWLQKPKRSAAGRRITVWPGGRIKRGYFLQEYIRGDACSAVFFGDGNRSQLLGVTRQLVGETWLNASPFVYCGSIGPMPLRQTLRRRIQKIGDRLTSAFEMHGMFGVDFILAGQTPYPVEINPRYTASVECLEYALRSPLLTSACDEAADDAQAIVGKAILYAKHTFTFPANKTFLDCAWSPDQPYRVPAYADIPHDGETIVAGHPIMTLFARAETIAACCRLLREKAESVDRDFNQL